LEEGSLLNDRERFFRSAASVRAAVIHSDKRRDLALIQVRSVPTEGVALTLAPESFSPAQRVHIVGMAGWYSGGLWGYRTGCVRQLVPMTVGEGVPVRVVQSDAEVNPGASGAPVVNGRGQLAAVVFAYHKKARSVSTFLDVQEVRQYLAEALPLATPASAEHYVRRRMRHVEEGRLGSAVSDFTAAIRMGPSSLDAYISRAWAFLAKGDPRTAKADLQRSLELDPQNVLALGGQGIALHRLGEYDAATAASTAFIQLHLREPVAYFQRGLSQLEMDRPELAEADFTQAIRPDPDEAASFARRAEARKQQDRIEGAINDYQMALQLAPNNDAYLNELGCCRYLLGQYKQGAEAFVKAWQLNAGDPHYLFNLGEALFELEQFDLAAKAYTEAIKLNESDSDFYNSRGVAQLRLERYQEAVADLTRAIQLDPEEALYYDNCAMALEELGQTEAANRDRATAAELDAEQFAIEEYTQEDEGEGDEDQIAQQLFGTWIFAGATETDRVEWTLRFSPNGWFQSRLATIPPTGEPRWAAETGTWKVEGQTLMMQIDERGSFLRSFEFRGDKLWIEFEEIGKVVGFARG